jgi:mono/diheme cytochrome c family protein
MARSFPLLSCLLLLAPAAPAQEAPAGVTFAEHVAPILHRHCTRCHRPGGGTPLDLTGYREARGRARLLAMVTRDGFMPPYPPGGDSPAYANVAPLSPDQVEVLARWVAGGSQPGDETELPPLPDHEAWELGAPDLVVESGEAVEVPLDALDLVRNFVLPLELEAPRWVRAVALEPGAGSLRRAFLWSAPRERTAAVTPDDPDSVLGLQDALGFSPPPEFGGELLTPAAFPYPDGAARLLEPGSALVLQAVFQGTGSAETVRPRLGLYFAESAPARTLLTVPVGRRELALPAGETTTVTASFALPVDARALGVLPVAHRLATRVRGWASLPDGVERTLVEIDDWDVAWASAYWLAEPIELPAGTTLHAELVFDNTDSNFSQVRFPPQDVGFGLHPADERAAVGVMLTVPGEPQVDALQEAWAAAASARP